ncbi:hypothetical protein BVRB_022790 [Beta vulgaris subsp. vulgaris]|uniref:Uncharacterized protein n=1 Tax=Beta vulgaris subsp. vulgaris TaxID=3555 RepID=A0A0J8DU19_BETVV|nr:hypothetical protein BVRB_022790 [Beta vulgaris subsp. vulgaris]
MFKKVLLVFIVGLAALIAATNDDNPGPVASNENTSAAATGQDPSNPDVSGGKASGTN